MAFAFRPYLKGLLTFFRVLLVALFIVFTPLTETAFAQAIPEDFEVSLSSAPVNPSALPGPMGIVVNDNDTAILTRTDTDGEETTKTLTLDPGASAAIWQAIQDQGFFALDPAYNDPAILDGDYAIIQVTANGETHEVRTTNIAVGAFDMVALWINSFLPPEDMVLYNAFIERPDPGDSS